MDLFNAMNNGMPQLWLPSPFAAANEAWVYEHLRSLQGSIIPQSYGFHETTLPAGYQVACHLLEELGGTSLVEWLESSPSHQDRWRMADEIYATVHLLHLLDIEHGDLSGRHFFVQPDNSLRLFDFGLAVLADRDVPPEHRFSVDAGGIYRVVSFVLGSEDAQLLHLIVRYYDGYPWTQGHWRPDWAVDLLNLNDLEKGRSRDYQALETDEGERRRICPRAVVKAAL